MKILVTGGTGYIGSHTVLELLKQNCDYTVAIARKSKCREIYYF